MTAMPRHKSAASASLFDKCRDFTRADELRAVGLYPYFRTIESAQDTEVVIDGRTMLMLGSNSYLGLTIDPRIKEAAKAAVDLYGSGCAGSRFLNGTLDIHIELEERIARFMNKEAALVFTTGFQVNLGVIAALAGRDDAVFIDRADHASILDGTRLGFGRVMKFHHNNMAHLDRLLGASDAKGKLIVVDGVYSMEGDICPLPELVEVAKRHDAAIMVDDAHSIGVLGSKGNGTANHFGLDDEVALIGGTFSKSLASIGGFVVGDSNTIDYLKHHARALIFSASPAPACVAAAIKALEILETEPEHRIRLWENTRFMQDGLRNLGFDIGASATPIIPVAVGELERCFAMWRRLHDEGLFVNPVVPPATPSTRCLMRVSVMASHTRPQLERALDIMERAGRELGIIGPPSEPHILNGHSNGHSNGHHNGNGNGNGHHR
ncbi:MAG: pyridoxal phosphate-dependent aminotransferase family protein [Candidatus Sumerlaeia bacterium]|nr:pyridoxal phosphate-dependent aminotransferase family protein [Candidatus Sumerlaeia bacterium]